MLTLVLATTATPAPAYRLACWPTRSRLPVELCRTCVAAHRMYTGPLHAPPAVPDLPGPGLALRCVQSGRDAAPSLTKSKYSASSASTPMQALVSLWTMVRLARMSQRPHSISARIQCPKQQHTHSLSPAPSLSIVNLAPSCYTPICRILGRALSTFHAARSLFVRLIISATSAL